MATIGNTFKPGGAAIPATQVEISVSCRNLADRDTFSKSDPICVLFSKELGQDRWYEYGRTEMIKDTLNPEFVKKFMMQYFFEQSQKLRFELYDMDSPSAKLDAHDFLGRMECTLGEVVGSVGSRLVKNLSGLSGRNGSISVSAEEVANCKEVATMQWCANKLDKKDFFGKSDPFLVFYRANEDGSYTKVHQTEVIMNTLNPTWRHFILPVRALCNGDYERSIKIQCYDWDSDGGHDFIGEFITNLREMSKTPSGRKTYECINPKKQAKKKSYKNSGTVTLMSCMIETQASFLDFVHGGLQLNFTVAIDFTASNGDPRSPQSLHYMSPHQPNQYSRALQAVGEIIQDYDSDKMFPALGFGARIPPEGKVSHEFFLNGDPNNPYCAGIHGVMESYQKTLHSVQLYGPTNFAPVINHVARFAQTYRDGTHYFILLILTDGVITDMPYTKEAIVNASSLPLSIIIVGVGDADFAAMDELDGDNKRLSVNGRYAERDIVQFVPFRDFVGGRYGNSLQVSQAYLAKEVLAEIPDQVTGFMKKNGFKPQDPPPAPPPGAAPPTTAPPTQAPPGGYGQNAPPPGGHGQNAPPHGGYGQNAPPPGGYGQNAPPPGGYEQNAPPPGGYGQNAPPPGGYAPPSGGYAPPGGGYAPPGGGYAPPGGGGQAPYPSGTQPSAPSW